MCACARLSSLMSYRPSPTHSLFPSLCTRTPFVGGKHLCSRPVAAAISRMGRSQLCQNSTYQQREVTNRERDTHATAEETFGHRAFPVPRERKSKMEPSSPWSLPWIARGGAPLQIGGPGVFVWTLNGVVDRGSLHAHGRAITRQVITSAAHFCRHPHTTINHILRSQRSSLALPKKEKKKQFFPSSFGFAMWSVSGQKAR